MMASSRMFSFFHHSLHSNIHEESSCCSTCSSSSSASTSYSHKIYHNPLKFAINAPNKENNLQLSTTPSNLPPIHPPETTNLHPKEDDVQNSSIQFRQEGQIFVGNLPLFIKDHEFEDFFRQFGPIKKVILIKAHGEMERNSGYGFVVYGGKSAADHAFRATEFDGIEFHGRALTVALDNGSRLKAMAERREKWIKGSNEMEFSNDWHRDRDISRWEFRKVFESTPEDWKSVVSAFDRIEKPSRSDYGLMVKFYGRRGDKHNARGVFESMRARGIKPSTHVYTSLIHAYTTARDMDEAVFCARKMNKEGVEISLVTYNVIVGGFAKIGDAESANNWFNEARARIGTLDFGIYGHLIYAYSRSCNMDRVEALVLEMDREGIIITSDIFHTLMNGYAIAKNEEKCITVFERMKELGFTPSIATYSRMINLYIRTGKITIAMDVCREMNSMGIRHNVNTYSMLINGFVQLKDWTNALAIFEQVIKDGLNLDEILCNNVIQAFCGMKNMDRALEMVKTMRKNGLNLTTHTFLPIIHSYAASGDVKTALDISNSMRKHGCIPNVHIYNSLILAWVETKNMEESLKILDEMARSDIKPDAHTHFTIMNGYAAMGDTEKLFQYLKTLKNDGEEVLRIDGGSIYETLLKACCRSGKMQSALAVTKEMSNQNMKKSIYTYNILMEGWARRGDLCEAVDLFSQMKEEGIRPNFYTYTNLIIACCRSGDMLRAMKMMREMKEAGLEANTRTYAAIISGWGRKFRPEEALESFLEMQSAGIKADRMTYCIVMRAIICTSRDMNEKLRSGVLRLCEEISECGVTLDMATAGRWTKYLRNMDCLEEISMAVQRILPHECGSLKDPSEPCRF